MSIPPASEQSLAYVVCVSCIGFSLPALMIAGVVTEAIGLVHTHQADLSDCPVGFWDHFAAVLISRFVVWVSAGLMCAMSRWCNALWSASVLLGAVGTLCVTVVNTDLALTASSSANCTRVVLRHESGEFLAIGSLFLMVADWMSVFVVLNLAYAYAWTNRLLFRFFGGSAFECGCVAWFLAASYCIMGMTAVAIGLLHGAEGCSPDFWGVSLVSLVVVCVCAPVIVSQRMVTVPCVLVLVVSCVSVYATAKALMSDSCTAGMRIQGCDNVLAIGNLMWAAVGPLACVTTLCAADSRICDGDEPKV
jgi:hypothetical protein